MTLTIHAARLLPHRYELYYVCDLTGGAGVIEISTAEPLTGGDDERQQLQDFVTEQSTLRLPRITEIRTVDRTGHPMPEVTR